MTLRRLSIPPPTHRSQVMQSCSHCTRFYNTRQYGTNCKKLSFPHWFNALPELFHTGLTRCLNFSTLCLTKSLLELRVSDKVVACGRSGHLTVKRFEKNFKQKDSKVWDSSIYRAFEITRYQNAVY